MEWLRRVLRSEIHESHVGIALIVCLLVMSAMSIALSGGRSSLPTRRRYSLRRTPQARQLKDRALQAEAETTRVLDNKSPRDVTGVPLSGGRPNITPAAR